MHLPYFYLEYALGSAGRPAGEPPSRNQEHKLEEIRDFGKTSRSFVCPRLQRSVVRTKLGLLGHRTT